MQLPSWPFLPSEHEHYHSCSSHTRCLINTHDAKVCVVLPLEHLRSASPTHYLCVLCADIPREFHISTGKLCSSPLITGGQCFISSIITIQKTITYHPGSMITSCHSSLPCHHLIFCSMITQSIHKGKRVSHSLCVSSSSATLLVGVINARWREAL